MGTPRYPKVLGYELVSEIGGGGFSTVFRAVNIPEHRVAACKLVSGHPDSGMSTQERRAVEKEMTIHRVLKHINVLEFLNAVVVEWKDRKMYVPGMYMLLEFAGGGDLFDKIAPSIGVDEGLARHYFLQILSGMRYIHSEGVCHRDLKPENLLLDAAGTLKIADFGLSTVFRLKTTGKTRNLTERCGTLPYVAPELNGNHSYEAEPIDVWGIGVILFALLVGDIPWDEPTEESLEFYHYSRGLIFSQDPWNRIGELPLDILRGLLEISPDRRLTLEEASRHPWVMRSDENLSKSNPGDIADRLVRAIKSSGDLELASPLFDHSHGLAENNEADLEGCSQFTQSLLLFSQTPSGTRYTPHLTRFYSTLEPLKMVEAIQSALESFEIKFKRFDNLTNELGHNVQKLRIGGLDVRKQMFKGWVEVENFCWNGVEGSFCIMKRDEGNPMSWRHLWKRLVCAQPVNPYVLKR